MVTRLQSGSLDALSNMKSDASSLTISHALATEVAAPAIASLPASAPARVADARAPSAPQPATFSLRLGIGLIGMLLASLLAILNEQVTAFSLADIQGALSIGHDDGTWLTTLFEAANVSTRCSKHGARWTMRSSSTMPSKSAATG